MRKDLLKHLVDFIALFLILALCFLGIYLFRNQVIKQIVMAGLLGVSYVFWGIFHHWHIGNLKLNIILEYFSMASLVVFVIMILLLKT